MFRQNPPVMLREQEGMRPQSCKSKGRRLQQQVARSIADAFPHLREDDAVSTSMGAGGEDVRLSPLARAALPLSIECKCTEKLNVWASLEQAQKNTPTDATPCLVFSRNRAPTYAVVPWRTLLALYASLYHHGGEIPTALGDALVQLGDFVDAERAKRARHTGTNEVTLDGYEEGVM